MAWYSVIGLVLVATIFTSGGGKNYIQKIPGSGSEINMVFIKGGTFSMGCSAESTVCNEDEKPSHSVTVDDFYMADMEITWNIYSLFMQRKIDPQSIPTSPNHEVQIKVDAVSGATTPYVEMSFGMGTDGYPAINATRFAAATFCKWLSAMTGNFYRLPTEAEWEYAARAGSNTTYSFGNDLGKMDEYAWHKGNSDGKYHKVGTKKPNAFGLYDMHGNVAEWTQDQYDATLYLQRINKSTDNPLIEATQTFPTVVKGGSWMDEAENLRSSVRIPSTKKWRKRDPQIPQSKWWLTDAPFVGFRIVRPSNVPPPHEQEKYWK